MPVTLQLRVSPRARRNAVTGRLGEAWKVAVTAPPADGRANDAVIELLAETLGVKRRQVVLVAGATSRDKVVQVTGLTADEIAARLPG